MKRIWNHETSVVLYDLKIAIADVQLIVILLLTEMLGKLAITISLAIIVGVIIHELFHAISAKLIGGAIHEIMISPFKGYVSFTTKEAMSLRKIGAIFLAGPLGNVFVAFLSWVLFDKFTAYIMIVVNLSMAIMNILPFYPADGYFVYKELLGLNVENSIKKRVLVSYISLVLFLAITVKLILIAFFINVNYTFLIPLSILSAIPIIAACAYDDIKKID